MTKKSKIVKVEKQGKLIEEYAAKRRELKAKRDYIGLSKLPKDSAPTRLQNRDMLDGRPRGCIRKPGLSRTKLRELAYAGKLPGVKKASW